MPAMKLLADENFPRRAVAALADQGHDIVWIRQASPGIDDRDVLEKARREDRVLLTFDKDFAALAFRDGIGNPAGVLLFRLTPRSPSYVADRVLAVVTSRAEWRGIFATVRDDLLVIRRPGGSSP